MNKALMLMTLKQFWSRKVRVLITAGLLAIPFVMDVMVHHVHKEKMLSAAGTAGIENFIVYAIGSGIIGLDIADGTMSSILSHPVSRWKYVVSKWFTVSALVVVLTLINILCYTIYALCVSGHPPSDIGPAIIEGSLISFGATSVLVLMSSLVPGAADIGVILSIGIACSFMKLLEEAFKVPGMRAVAETIEAILNPTFDPSVIKGLQSLFSIEVGRYVAVVLVCLCGAVILVNQKELSYGSN